MDAPKRPGFTLVELIVVIAVLAILGSIAFTQVQNVTLGARNSARLTDVTTIVSKLEMQTALGKLLPKPENGVDLIASGSVVGYQGNFGTASARTLDFSEIKDPLDNTYYTYTTDSKLGSYQLLGFKESTTSHIPVNTTYAATNKAPFTKGNLLGVLIDTNTTTPIEKTYPNSQIDIINTSSGLTAVFSDSKQLTGTGIIFGGSMWSLLTKQADFNAPKTCPTGFIPVLGNAEFLQPGFCVAKYEMKQATGDQGRYTYNGTAWVPAGDAVTPYCTNSTPCATVSGTWSKGNIISKADGYPIVWINQYNASEACKSMGEGYHLITNNEWMTAARNAEQVATNWIGGIVGTGAIYSGHNNNSPSTALSASADDTQGYIGTYDNIGSGANQKRTLVLSNGQVIWDLAGNVWEHVNKANTTDGNGYANGSNWTSNACGGSTWYSFYGNDGVAQCSYQNSYTYANTGPLTANLNAANGIGRIYSYSTANNVFLRGCDWGSGAYTGVFTLHMSWDASISLFNVGFRCAK